MRRLHLLLAATAGTLIAPALFAARLQFSTGAEYFKGDFGEVTPTEVLVVPFSARLSLGSFSLRGSLPLLSMRGPADVAPVLDEDGADRGASSGVGPGGNGPKGKAKGKDNGKGPGGGGSASGSDAALQEVAPLDYGFADDHTARGMGDATLSAAWSFQDVGGTRLYVDVTGRVRLPTGDESRGLGRGTTDYATLAELGWDGSRGGLFVLGGRQYLESTPTLRRRDTWQSSVGGWINLWQRSLVGLQGNWREASTAAGTAARSVDVFLNLGVAAGWRIDVSGSAGLSRTSPDYAIGLGLTWKSPRR